MDGGVQEATTQRGHVETLALAKTVRTHKGVLVDHTPEDPVIKLTCLLKRKEGLTPAEFQAYWRDHHAPLIRDSSAANYVLRYEQNPRPLDSYRGDDDRSGYDGVTVQWFASMEAYEAHMREDDFPAMFEDIAKFLDLDHLDMVLTEEPRLIIDGEVAW